MYYLEKDSNMTFDLNYDVEPYIKALFPYTDKDGHQYISFQNGFKNQIVFYDIQTKEMAFKIDLDIEGDNGVGFFLGYYIDSLDSIYLTSLQLPEIYSVNKEGKINKKIYYDSLDNINENDWENIKNVVFVDDCSGTGNQFVEFLKRQKKSMVGKRIILIAIEIVEDAKVYIDNYAKKHGIDIHIIAYSVKKKAFKTASDMEKNKFIEMSQKVKIDNKYILGFKNAEALMAFYNNSPNDTLGLFWFPSGENNPIFPRELEDEPGWKCYHKKKNERRRRQYETKCR